MRLASVYIPVEMYDMIKMFAMLQGYSVNDWIEITLISAVVDHQAAELEQQRAEEAVAEAMAIHRGEIPEPVDMPTVEVVKTTPTIRGKHARPRPKSERIDWLGLHAPPDDLSSPDPAPVPAPAPGADSPDRVRRRPGS